MKGKKMNTKETKWQRLCDEVNRKGGDGEAFVAAMKEQYAIHSRKVLEWLAGLYDPNIGGFYYSNSARDNEYAELKDVRCKLLPDIESTNQALGFLETCGFYEEGDYSRLPLEMRNKAAEFVCSLEDPDDGFFYHPQWGKEMTDSHRPRRGRDLTMVTRILDWCGISPTYDTPTGIKGDGLLADGTPAKVSSQAVVSEAPDSGKAFDPVLKDKDSFIEYLSGFEIDLDKPNTSYEVGSAFECQATQIAARDKELEAAGADYRLADILAEWFEKYQDPETGIFCKPEHLGVRAINGVLKIAGTYDRIGRPFPNAVAAFRSARNAIISDEEPNTVCWVLNPWYSLTVIMNNVAENSRKNNDYAAERQIAELRAEMIKNYPEMIRATARKLKKFRKPDGSFSYLQDRTSHVSHEMPVAISGTNEGDVNSTNICCAGIVGHIFVMLKQEMIPFFTEADRMRYVAIIEEKERNGEKNG